MARSIATSLQVWQSKTVLKSGFYAVDSDSRFPIPGKKEAVEFRTIITLILKKERNVHAYITTLRVCSNVHFQHNWTMTYRIVSRQTGKLITLRRVVFFYFRSVPFQLFQSHKCFIDVFEILSSFIVTHNKCIIINVTPSVCVTFSFICFPDTFLIAQKLLNGP